MPLLRLLTIIVIPMHLWSLAMWLAQWCWVLRSKDDQIKRNLLNTSSALAQQATQSNLANHSFQEKKPTTTTTINFKSKSCLVIKLQQQKTTFNGFYHKSVTRLSQTDLVALKEMPAKWKKKTNQIRSDWLLMTFSLWAKRNFVNHCRDMVTKGMQWLHVHLRLGPVHCAFLTWLSSPFPSLHSFLGRQIIHVSYWKNIKILFDFRNMQIRRA